MLHVDMSSILHAQMGIISSMETEMLGDRIRRLRIAAGLTQSHLAKAGHVSVSAISQIERGESESPKPETLLGIARALRQDLESLIDPKGDPRITLNDDARLILRALPYLGKDLLESWVMTARLKLEAAEATTKRQANGA